MAGDRQRSRKPRRFEHEDAAIMETQLPRDCQPHDTRTDRDGIGLFHEQSSITATESVAALADNHK